MIGSHQIEPTSTDGVLNHLGLAIDEAKLVRKIISAREQAGLEQSRPNFSGRLAYLNREIDFLERELARVRARAFTVGEIQREPAS